MLGAEVVVPQAAGFVLCEGYDLTSRLGEALEHGASL
jgi:hypothetical protein